MNKSQKIYTSTETRDIDKHLTIKLEQETDTLEFMSLKIDTKEVYRNFNSDFGVLVGRITANGGVGIPNAKVSIFIPLSEDDKNNNKIVSIYPYTSPKDKDNYGKRYNLLPRVSTKDPITNEFKPKQPFGSFPTKEEVVTNETTLEVYKKYYKFSTVTNDSGDYMIFGVPIGTQTVHMSCDITDIGKYSMNPASMITNLGYSPNLFSENGSKIKPANDLDDLPNIETQEISVDIVSFWGDKENFEIGITRQDFRIRATLVNTFTIFGSAFTDGSNATWGSQIKFEEDIYELYRVKETDNDDLSNENIGMVSKRIGKITEKVYYYPNSISDENIDSADPSEMNVLDPSEYSIYKRDGDFVLILNCNRRKIVTNDFGEEIVVSDSSDVGVFTQFKGFITLEITSEEIDTNMTSSFDNNGDDTRITTFRYKLKFPQHANIKESFEPEETQNTNNWRKQHFTFESGKFYSVARFHPTVHQNVNTTGRLEDKKQFEGSYNTNYFFDGDVLNEIPGKEAWSTPGIIISGDYSKYINSDYEFPSNSVTTRGDGFGANWMNLSIYLPHVGYVSKGYSWILDVRTIDAFARQKEDNKSYNGWFSNANTQEIAAGDINTVGFARSDINWTDIIEVPIPDIKTLKNINSKKYDSSNGLIGKYRNGEYVPDGWLDSCPYKGGKKNGLPTNDIDPNTYIYKGFDSANCIDYLFELGIVT